MKTTNLEYTNIPVLLPAIDYFIDKLKNNEPFHFLRINHGIIDLIHLGYEDLSEFENHFITENFEAIAEKMISGSERDIYNNPFKIHHKNSDKLKEKILVFLNVLKNNKQLSEKIDISVSLGVGLSTYWGVWHADHQFQIGRKNVWEIIDKHKTVDFYYSGVLKHYAVKKEIFSLFELLNELNFSVIFVGREYLNLYKDTFNIKNFYHIQIPSSGAIEHIDDYVDSIKDIATKSQNTIVLHSTGHILSAYMAYQLKDTKIFGLDIGISFDILLKEKIGSDWIHQWIVLDENHLNHIIDNLRK
jgi:hypothetical protein